MDALARKYADAIWVARTLFSLGRATGSTGNLSFLHEGNVYISCGGSLFGTLSQADFAIVDGRGNVLGDRKPSKELPLHSILYEKDAALQAVIHTHSFYAVLWSCLSFENARDVVPAYTPYLRMRVGKIGQVSYAPPGSPQLADALRGCAPHSEGYLLQNHGPLIGAKTMLDAFSGIEELEESCKIAWHIRAAQAPAATIG